MAIVITSNTERCRGEFNRGDFTVTIDGKPVEGITPAEFKPNAVITIDGHIGGFQAQAVAIMDGGYAHVIQEVIIL
jgi:hypothetical protein